MIGQITWLWRAGRSLRDIKIYGRTRLQCESHSSVRRLDADWNRALNFQWIVLNHFRDRLRRKRYSKSLWVANWVKGTLAQNAKSEDILVIQDRFLAGHLGYRILNAN
jgi:hypothetical protein